MIGIYKITCNETGKCYIGQSIDIENRWFQHICAAKYETDNNKFYNAMRKYGYENFTYEIIEECSNSQAELDDRERYWIEYYNSYEDGYNSTRGGQNKAWIYDPEIIRKMWDDGFTTGEIKQVLGCSKTTINSRLRGYKDFNTYTSHQRSCGASATFRKLFTFSDKQKEFFGECIPVYQYDLDGNYLNSFPSLEAAVKAIGAKSPDNISNCWHRENQKTAYGYQWSKIKVDKMPIVPKYSGKLVRCINTGEIFHSIPEAAAWANIKSKSNIRECCDGSGRYKSAGKHPITGEKLKWEYVDDTSNVNI